MSDYAAASRIKAQRLADNKSAILLAIETSCDETAAAVVRDGRVVLGSTLFSQIDLHKVYGGVVPEIASRSHIEKIGGVVAQALELSGMDLRGVDAIAVTYCPGLVGALLVGVSYAKALAFALDIPLVGVNHIAGHICANLAAHHALTPPFISLVASGGHSNIVVVRDYGEYELIGKTRDDAAGEAFDKIARALGLPYPGGPELEKLAQSGDKEAFKYTLGFNGADHYDFSFSGLKTAVVNQLHNAAQKNERVNHADIAASAQQYIVKVLAGKTVRAAKAHGVKIVTICGGVAANTALRKEFARQCEPAGLELMYPPAALCTDNAAMIGCAGYYELMRGRIAGLDLNASPASARFSQ